MPPGMNLEQMLKVMATANAAAKAAEAVEDKPEPKSARKAKAES